MKQPPITVDTRADGTLIVSGPKLLTDDARTLVDWLEHWAALAPERALVSSRAASGEWIELRYGEALETARRLGARLLELGGASDRPLLVLAPNGLAHAEVMFAGLYAGVPVASISPAYATAGSDFSRLGSVFDTLRPGVVFAEDAQGAGAAIRAMRDRHEFKVLESTRETAVQASSHRMLLDGRSCLGASSVAKVVFTSGSTGAPKGVMHTHGMWSANQEQIAQVWPFLSEAPPVLLDWLPWSHTFGGNHNLGLERGIAFAGRTAEEFKLLTGTWVQASAIRLRAIEAFAPLVQDVAVAGANRDFIGLLLFMNRDNCSAFLGAQGVDADIDAIASHPRVHACIRQAMERMAASGGSSTYPARCLIELAAADPAAGEITDKGYLNQAAVLRHRAASVERLYANAPDAGVIRL